MNHDPYAAPDMPPTEGRQGPAEGEPQPWEIGEVMSLAWERFQAHWPVLAFTYLPMNGVLFALGHVGDILVWRHVVRANSPPSMAIDLASVLAALVAGAFFQVGFLRIVLDVARDQPVRFWTLFSGGSQMWTMLASNVLVGLATFAGVLLLIVPGIIIALGMALAPYYVVDAGLGPVQAMKASWAATDGHRGDILVLFLTGIGLTLLGLLMLVLGLAATGPTFALAQAIVFTRMSGRGAVVRYESLAPPAGWPLIP
ncbi:MAG: hypothetical protein ABTD50_11385 [Polyangiaceae bacterium]